LNDKSVDVRLIAGEALSQLGYHTETLPLLAAALRHPDNWVQLRTPTRIDQTEEKSLRMMDDVQNVKGNSQLVQHILQGIQPKRPDRHR
jgi:HEAT repeat protein